MTSFGYLLLIGGFLLASYATALDARMTDWMLFAPAAAAAIVGVLAIKRQARGHARSEQVLSANRAELEESLGNVVRDLSEIDDEAASISLAALRQRIDGRLRNDLRRFADARESMVHLYGLQAYADIMSEFAAGERYINRAWSAAADEYGAEARTYLGKALTQFRSANGRLGAAGRGTVMP